MEGFGLRRGVLGDVLYTEDAAPSEIEDRSVRFVASTNSVDRYGDIIQQDWDTRDFFQNPLLLWAHMSRETPIGRVTEFSVSDDGRQSIARAQFLPKGQNPFADEVCLLMQQKFLNAFSVGFIPTKIDDRMDGNKWAGWSYSGNKLVEISVVTVPANAEAVQIGRSLGLEPRQLRAFFREPPAAVTEHGLKLSQRHALEAELELIKIRRRRHIDRWSGQVA